MHYICSRPAVFHCPVVGKPNAVAFNCGGAYLNMLGSGDIGRRENISLH
jgi:hypothetical protein